MCWTLYTHNDVCDIYQTDYCFNVLHFSVIWTAIQISFNHFVWVKGTTFFTRTIYEGLDGVFIMNSE